MQEKSHSEKVVDAQSISRSHFLAFFSDSKTSDLKLKCVIMIAVQSLYVDISRGVLRATRCTIPSWRPIMRLFIAINFNNDTRSRLLALCDELRGKSERGRFSLQENLHLTLAFLGECDGKQTSAVKSVLAAVSYEPFDIAVDCVGRFRRDGGDLWWAGLRESEPLIALQGDLTEKLIVSGFSLDKRRYNPHITLGREVKTGSMPESIEPFGETVTSIDLMKSERINGKLTYTAIYTKEAAVH